METIDYSPARSIGDHGRWLSPSPRYRSNTSAETCLPISRAWGLESFDNCNPWESLIEATLSEWAQNPEVFANEGLEAPHSAIIEQAMRLARAMKFACLPPPDRIMPDSSGGIVFERAGEQSGAREVVHFWDDGSIEHQLFQGAKLFRRKVIVPPQ